MEPLEGTFIITGSCKPSKNARNELGAENVSTKYMATINFNGVSKQQIVDVLQHKSSIGVQIDNHVRQNYLDFEVAKPLPDELTFDLTSFMSRGHIVVPAPVAARNAVRDMTRDELEQHKRDIAVVEAALEDVHK